MADELDLSAERQQAERDRGVARARAAAAAISDPILGTCEACCDEDVMVRPCGGMPRCTPCRSGWEQRR